MKTTSFTNPPVEIGAKDPVCPTPSGGTPDGMSPGYVLYPNEGPALWFHEALFSVKARSVDTEGQFSLFDQVAPKGFAAPPHFHSDVTDSFYIVDGELDYAVGDTVYYGITTGGFIYIPHSTRHEFRVVSETAHFLLLCTPGGFEGYFEDLGSPAQEFDLPPTGHRHLLGSDVLAAKRKWGAMPTNDASLFCPIEDRAVLMEKQRTVRVESHSRPFSWVNTVSANGKELRPL